MLEEKALHRCDVGETQTRSAECDALNRRIAGLGEPPTRAKLKGGAFGNFLGR